MTMDKKIWNAPQVLSIASAKEAALSGIQKYPGASEYYTLSGPAS